MNKVLLLDLCGTFYKSNTTFDFLSYYLSGYKRFVYKYIFRSVPFRCFCKIYLSFFGKDIFRYSCVYLLRGDSFSNLEARASEFLETIELIDQVKNKLESIREEYDEIYFISASIDIIVKVAARKFLVNGYYSSTLQVREIDGVYCVSGFFERDLLFDKKSVINDCFKEAKITFITDNRTDRPCLELCDKFIAVYKKDCLEDALFWKRNGVTDVIEYE
ncbi:hypothetical protein AB6C46_18490 [Vibrio sp. 10N.237.312.C02]|uniref:hypothetical protein n=1 Tax=unclassified Vibrio TaxID=2614977 RepID=UPI00352E0D9F